jgi:hypothetical protein
MRAKSGWSVVAGLAVMGGAALVWQWHATSVLRAEVAAHQPGVRATRQLRSENERLRAGLTNDGPVSAAGDDATLQQARAETASLRQRANQVVQTAEQAKATPAGRFGADSRVPGSEWRNAGAATPQAALETVLWAAAGGDVDAFANSLVLPDARAHVAAQALFDSLPGEARGRYRSPEQLIAALTIPDIPTGYAQVKDWQDWQMGQTEQPWWAVRAALATPDGKWRWIGVWFAPRDGGWKLVVTDTAVTNLAAKLQGQVSAACAK